MQNWKYKLASFMYGRYGIDALYYGLFTGWLFLHAVSVFADFWPIALLGWGVMGFAVFRVFSRNLTRRRKENEAFMKLWRPVKEFFKLQYHRVRDCRTSVYRKCPGCRAVLRLPRRRGTHTTNCPRCTRRFDVRILF